MKRLGSTTSSFGFPSVYTGRTVISSETLHAVDQCPRPEDMQQDMYQGIFLHAPASLWVEDFSEVKRRLDQIKRKSGDDLRTYLQRHPEEVIALARKVKVIEVNEATLRLYGAKTKEDLCQGLSQVFNKESYDVFREELIALADGKTSFSSEAVNRTLGGEEVTMLMHITVPPGFEQTLSRVLVSINDITELKRAEVSLRESEEKYRKIFEAACDAIFIADAQSGIILGANAMAEKLIGLPSEKIIGMNYLELHPAEERERYRRLFQRHIGSEGLMSEDVIVRHQSGKKIPVSVVSSMVDVADRQYIVGVFRKAVAHEAMQTEPPAESVTGSTVSVKDELLTRRECEILRHIVAGVTTKQVAQMLKISEKTVSTHRTRLMKKLKCHNAAQLIKYAAASHIIE